LTSESIQTQALRDPDVRLMLEVRDGSGTAFEQLVQRYQGRLLTVLEHLTGQREQAEDLAQEVFLRVYRSRATYFAGAKFSTWLFTIANNVAASALRSRGRRHEVKLEVHDTGPWKQGSLEVMAQAASGQMPARQLDKAEMRDVVQAALGALNERQRLAVLLNKFEGMSYQEIAEVMELTPKAVKSLLSRARLNLRDILQPYLESGQSPALGA
jgi:RNA polymerase sigma-70 factor, ECF subfamily